MALHARGQPAIAPITGCEVFPPRGRDVDEATTWFLDYFSRRELAGFLRAGRSVPASAAAWCASFPALTLTAIVYAARHLGVSRRDPGPRPALASLE